jgi:hypothetical protein
LDKSKGFSQPDSLLVEVQDRKVEEKPSMIILGCDFHPSWFSAVVPYLGP